MNLATIEALLKLLFSEVYGAEAIEEIESSLKNALSKYKNSKELQTKLCSNASHEAEPLLQEFKKSVCQREFSHRKRHTSQTLLLLAKFFYKIEDYRISCELLWGSASMRIQEFVESNELKVELRSHESKRRFASWLSEDTGRRFLEFEMCHQSFYSDRYNLEDMQRAMREADNFDSHLKSLKIDPEKLKELVYRNFN